MRGFDSPCDFLIGPDVQVKVLAGLLTFLLALRTRAGLAKVVLLLMPLGLVLFELTSIPCPLGRMVGTGMGDSLNPRVQCICC